MKPCLLLASLATPLLTPLATPLLTPLAINQAPVETYQMLLYLNEIN